MSWVEIGLVVIVIALLAGAASWIIRLRRQQEQLRHELRRVLRAGATSVETQLSELEWRRTAFDRIDAGIIVTDRNKHILATNQVADEFFGQVVPATTAIALVRHHALEAVLDQALAGIEGEPQILTVEGRELRVWGVSWGEGGIAGAMLILRDITSHQRLLRARRDFAGNISHELRTPLASMKILLETLQNGALENLQLAQRLIAKLARENEAMIRLVEDMTTLALIESGRTPLALQSTSLADLVHDRVARLAPHTALKAIQVQEEVPASLLLLLDRERFGQVLTNLLDNAIKFTPDGGTVRVRGCMTPEAVRLEVDDTGPGIAPDDLPRIFERFYKSDRSRDRSTAERSTGLGLAIAKHLVEAHGGHIWAESPPGRGARLIIELPNQAEQGAAT